MKIVHVVGARPNFMKAAPVLAALAAYPQVTQILVHTGQHYDANMSDVFFQQLGMPQPDINLGIGSGSHAAQTAQVMVAFEEVVLAQRPDWVLVYGDINSTVAAALVCAKLHVRVVHVEAGLRSFDRSMPEEINRLVTDQIADLLLTPSSDGDENLLREGIPAERIRCVGNVMIDTLVRLLPQADAHWHGNALPMQGVTIERGNYVLVTLHRPSNVDDGAVLAQLVATLMDLAQQTPVLFPVHPRTRRRMQDANLTTGDRLHLLEPLGYLEFLALQRHARLVITDSGGIQEETTYLGVPCLTVRENTERPVTVTIGTNQLVGQDMTLLKRESERILQGQAKAGAIPPLWDGQASARIAQILTGESV